MKTLRLILASLVLVLVLPFSARADYYVWKDQKTGLSMTFPDTWKQQSNANPDTIMTVMGPSKVGQPLCRVDVRLDKRYTVYPPRYGDDVQKVAVSKPFWDRYLAQYTNVKLDRVHDGAGLGRWFASYALASYTREFGTILQDRRAILFASLYNDKMYVVECSSISHDYERWAGDFRSIIKSIDFKKAYHEVPTGEYANFLEEGELYFWSQTGADGTTAY